MNSEVRTITFSISDDGKLITCLLCGMTSFNPNDVEHRYCGKCHVFHHDFPKPMVRFPESKGLEQRDQD